MNDDEDETPQERMAKVELYMESVKARMAPEDFETLHEAVNEMSRLITEGHEGVLEAGDRENFAGEVQREFLAVMAIATTGRMDHHVIDMPGPDGSPGYAVVTPEVANDPAALAEVRQQIHQWTTEQREINSELDGIARASGIDPDE
ncbi:hypothetical protein [Streptomyces sp. Tu 2975]|uniref:hypothetical protein n=1 Tax=Streptomyces sp. Tu 2975 TaxID=2676871 RepID=UPI001FCA3FEA|nr:hypothetical protein [Streptomyces sp. Tu 2975]